ncbi:DoxX family protein [Nitrosopumilus piranensis]|uniref:DoxX family protein n=1 Tax=Nitrosopumilus piranensis TaxID=1582439 RepID=A0A0C5BVG5_9ARCH|nr:DoxX family protein [Nitrosopumilus piranensis]AJM92224.1 DoxX family protein [Nitrosopumilus piranensis]
MKTEAVLKGNILHDITHWGISASIGAIFLVHSLKKFDPSWQEWLSSIGMPPEMQLPIALAEFIGGILLIAGVLTRITGAVFAIILLGAIFHIRWESGFFVSQGGWEWDLVMLAAVLAIIAAGPGRISIAHVAKRIPRFLQ